MSRKYRNVPTTHNGIRYASKAECAYAQELEIAQRAGRVLWWIRQPRFDLPGGVTYASDFLVRERGWSTDMQPVIYAVDVKGMETQAFKIKKRLFRATYPHLPLRVVKRKGKRFVDAEACATCGGAGRINAMMAGVSNPLRCPECSKAKEPTT